MFGTDFWLCDFTLISLVLKCFFLHFYFSTFRFSFILFGRKFIRITNSRQKSCSLFEKEFKAADDDGDEVKKRTQIKFDPKTLTTKKKIDTEKKKSRQDGNSEQKPNETNPTLNVLVCI